jgi:hypothetical protein
LANGAALISIFTARDKIYSIEQTDGVGGPWVTATNNLAGTGWLLDLLLSDAQNSSHRFYRVKIDEAN